MKYSCENCGYQAKQKSGLIHHVSTMHEGFEYACLQCDYKTAFNVLEVKLKQIEVHSENIKSFVSSNAVQIEEIDT